MPGNCDMSPISPLWREGLKVAGPVPDGLRDAILLEWAQATLPANENAATIGTPKADAPRETGQHTWRLSACWVPTETRPGPEARFEIYRVADVSLASMLPDDEGWRWRLRMGSDRILASGGGYRTRRECERAVDWLRRYAGSAPTRPA